MNANEPETTDLVAQLGVAVGLIGPGVLETLMPTPGDAPPGTLAERLVAQGTLTDDEARALETLAESWRKRGPGMLGWPGSSLSTRAPSASNSSPTVPETVAPTGPWEDGPAGPGIPAGPRYRVLHLHARGGLGEVFLARDEELNREVALKEIRGRLADDPFSRSRFVLEAEVTGNLEHPGIVPVYGLGHHPDGRPYYAMRFIRGESLKDAIERFHGRDPRASSSNHATAEGTGEPPSPEPAPRPAEGASRDLELRRLLRRFLDVCNAIAYAHSKGVLHRDIKPENIMLGRFGETLVVDWGLAKMFGRPDEVGPGGEAPIGSGSGQGYGVTLAGSAVGTPGYMSPEQAKGQLDRLGPASDVYSLGMTLRHLLTGVRPTATIHGPVDIPRPAESALADAQEAGVPRALLAIGRKATAHEPGDRYPTALALAAEVERWLGDEPLEAFPETLAARAGRWGRRHRPLVAGALSLMLTAIVALSASTLFVLREKGRTESASRNAIASERRAILSLNQAREAAEAERVARDDARNAEVRARGDAETARRTADFLVGMFNASDPIGLAELGRREGSTTGGPLTALDLLDRGTRRIDVELRDRPLVRANLLDTMGNVTRSLADYETAERLLDEALAIRREHLPADHPDIAASLLHRGWLNHDRGDFEKAEPDLVESLRICRETLGEDDIRTAESLFHVAWVKADLGAHDEAEPLFRRVIEAHQNKPGRERPLAIARMGYAALMLDRGQGAQAIPLVLAAMPQFLNGGDMELAAKVARDFLVGVGLKGGGGLLQRTAVDRLQSALDGARALFPADHPYLPFILHELAGAKEGAGDLAGAEETYRDCMAVIHKTPQGLAYPKGLLPVHAFARLLARSRRLPEATALYEELIEARRRRFGPDHARVAEALVALADLQNDWRKYEPARANLASALEIYQQGRGRPIGRDEAAGLYPDVLLRLDRAQEARAFLLEEMGRRPPGDPALPRVVRDLGRAEARLGRPATAEWLYEDAIAGFGTLPRPGRDEIVKPQEDLALLRWSRGGAGDRDSAMELFHEMERVDQAAFGARSGAVAYDLEWRAGLLTDMGEGKGEEAAACLERALRIREAQRPAVPDRVFDLLERLAVVKLGNGDRAGYQALCKALIDRFGANAPVGTAERIGRLRGLAAGSPPEFEEAMAVIAGAIGTSPGTRDILLAQAILAYRHGEPARAAEFLEKSRGARGDRRSALQGWLEAALAAERGDFAAAGAAIEQARAGLAGDYPQPWQWDRRAQFALLEAELAASLRSSKKDEGNGVPKAENPR